MSTEPNMRRRMLDAFQGVVQSMKWMIRQPDFAPENVGAIVERMADRPDAEDPFGLNNLFPAGIGTLVSSRWLDSLDRRPAQPQQVNNDDIPLD